MKWHTGNKWTPLSKRDGSEKVKYYIIITLAHSGKSKTMETVKRSVVARDCEVGGINRWKQGNFRSVTLFCMTS